MKLSDEVKWGWGTCIHSYRNAGQTEFVGVILNPVQIPFPFPSWKISLATQNWRDAESVGFSLTSKKQLVAVVTPFSVWSGCLTHSLVTPPVKTVHWSVSRLATFLSFQAGPWRRKGTLKIHSSREGSGTPLQDSCLETPMDGGAWWAAVHVVAKGQTRLSNFTITFPFHALEKEMATHSSVLAWRIPGTGKPGGLLSMGLHRVGHDWCDLAAAAEAAAAVQRTRMSWPLFPHTFTLFQPIVWVLPSPVKIWDVFTVNWKTALSFYLWWSRFFPSKLFHYLGGNG